MTDSRSPGSAFSVRRADPVTRTCYSRLAANHPVFVNQDARLASIARNRLRTSIDAQTTRATILVIARQDRQEHGPDTHRRSHCNGLYSHRAISLFANTHGQDYLLPSLPGHHSSLSRMVGVATYWTTWMVGWPGCAVAADAYCSEPKSCQRPDNLAIENRRSDLAQDLATLLPRVPLVLAARSRLEEG